MKHVQVVFLGPVGVGKSTQISLLYNYFKRNEISVCRRYLKSFYPNMLRFIVKFACGVPDKRLDGSIIIGLHPEVVRRLIKWMLMIDLVAVIVTYLLTIKTSLFFRQVVLVEESLLGTMMEYLDAAWNGFVDKRFVAKLVSFLLLLVQGNNLLLVMLNAEPSRLEERWIKRQSYSEKEMYLQSQYRAMKLFLKWYGNRTILVQDEDKGVMDVHNSLINQLCALS